jgi:dihydroxyacetone kinase-like predicted kinase
MAEKTVLVVPSAEQQAGLAAAVALNTTRPARENAAAMEEILAELRTGTVAPAARDDAQGRFAVGDAVGYVGDDLVAWGDPAATLEAVLGALAADAELLTVISGDGAPLSGEEVAALLREEVELELGEGGQPSRWWLVSAE